MAKRKKIARHVFEMWYWSDWQADPKVGRLSAAGRGVWVELLGLMWQDRTFFVEDRVEDIAQRCRLKPVEVAAGIEELGTIGVANVTLCNAIVTVESRRKKRKCNAREKGRLRVQKHRNSANGNGQVTQPVTPGTPYIDIPLSKDKGYIYLSNAEKEGSKGAPPSSAVDASTPPRKRTGRGPSNRQGSPMVPDTKEEIEARRAEGEQNAQERTGAMERIVGAENVEDFRLWIVSEHGPDSLVLPKLDRREFDSPSLGGLAVTYLAGRSAL